ncbi:MAG: VC0807 family protein [Caulobacteraceae bacterium]
MLDAAFDRADPRPMSEALDKAKTFVRERGPTIAVEIGVNFALPLLVFDYAKPSLGEVHALMVSSGPPIVWSLIEFARKRRVDALSIIVLAGIGLSLLMFLGGGSAKFLQLREKLVTVIIGVGFLISVMIRRPLIYELARASIRRQDPSQLADFEARRDEAGFKRVMNFMTLVWGFGLVADAAAGCVLVMALSVHDYLIFGPIEGYGAFGALMLWNVWYARRARRRGDERRAAEAAAREAAG